MTDTGGKASLYATDRGLPTPRWDLGGQTWLFVGDEVALAKARHNSDVHNGDAYGRIVGLDPDGSGHPVVLVLAGDRRGVQAPTPLTEIFGKRAPAAATARAGGGREDRLWSSSLRNNEGAGWL
jgi:hypothetical protein